MIISVHNTFLGLTRYNSTQGYAFAWTVPKKRYSSAGDTLQAYSNTSTAIAFFSLNKRVYENRTSYMVTDHLRNEGWHDL